MYLGITSCRLILNITATQTYLNHSLSLVGNWRRWMLLNWLLLSLCFTYFCFEVSSFSCSCSIPTPFHSMITLRLRPVPQKEQSCILILFKVWYILHSAPIISFDSKPYMITVLHSWKRYIQTFPCHSQKANRMLWNEYDQPPYCSPLIERNHQRNFLCQAVKAYWCGRISKLTCAL